MSVESKPNRLTKGLVLDTFHTDVDNTVATYALNSQLEDQEGNHFHYGSEVGTNHIKDIPDNHVVIGHINMERNETVLFTTDGTNSTIGILSRNDDMSYNYEIKVDDTDQKKKLNFKKNGYVRGVYRLLNGCDKVIYFVDGVNKDRRVNFNKLDSYKDPASTASGIIFDDSLKATIYALSSATGNIQLIRLMSANAEATANVLATLTSGAELTKLLTASANGIGTALANLIRTANIVSSIEATGTSTVNVDIVRLLQSNVSAIGSVNAILESLQQGIVEIDVTLTGVASSTAILLRAALLEVNLTTEATTLANAILTRIINAQIQALANTESSAQISIPINAAVDATATTAADAILSYAINATVDAMAQTSATAQLSKVITASVDALADSSSELLIGLVLVSTNIAGSSTSTANLFINRLLTSSVTAQGTTTAEAVIAKLLSSSLTSTSTTTADSLISKLLASTVDATGTVTANLQLADLLSTTVNGTATTEAVLEAINLLIGDPYIDNVSLLLQGDNNPSGVTQNNTFIDSSTNNFTITPNGNVTQGTFSPFDRALTNSGGSAYFDGTGDTLTVSSYTATNVGTGDFTFEIWVYPTSFADYRVIFDTRVDATANPLVFGLDITTGYPYYYTGTTYTGNAGPVLNIWNHIAFTRSGTAVNIWVNGTSVLSRTDSSNLTGTSIGTIRLGSTIHNIAHFVGYISNFRVIKGTALYTSSFTPPTTPLTAITNTSLLLNFTNAAIFDGVKLNNIETVGNAQISTAQSKFGGSLAFDGNGDYLTIPINSNLAFGTGNFTIEFWFRLNNVTGVQHLYDSRPSTTDGTYPTIRTNGTAIEYVANGIIAITGSTLSANTWYHVAVTRSGTSTKLFLDGNQVGSTYTDNTNYLSGTSRPLIGGSGYHVTTLSTNGYIDDLRITKGIARYTTNFNTNLPNKLSSLIPNYLVSRSLRFNSADSTHLTRTFSVAGTRTTWTWSGWVKLSNFSSSGFIFGASSGLNIDGGITINMTSSSNYIGISLNGNVYNKNVTVTLRDTSAWYHIVGVFNTTLSTPADRIKIYVNGIEIITYTTANSGLPPQNFIPNYLNNANLHTIGKLSGYDQDYLNCYMTEVNFIDGLALTPDSFGERDINTGVWKPKDYTGVYGTNGFHLTFSDITQIGRDFSGKNNNWTPNNFSVTPGVGYDSLTDVPTPNGTDNGFGGEVRGNYAVLNPLETTTLTKPTNGNLDYSPSNIAPQVAISTIAIPSTGKWYAEVTKGSSSSSFSIGVIGTLRTAQYVGHTDSIGYFDNGQIYKDNSLIQSSLAAYAFGDTIGIAVDAVAQTVQFYKNGLTVGTAISYTYSQISFACGNYLSGQIYNVNFGQRPFAYQAPTGFKALNTANLPTPAIGGGGESNLANKYMDITTYTGTGAAQSIFNSGFKPDFVWIKSRSAATSHAIYDISRGVQKRLSSDSTNAQVTDTTGLSSFDNTGFSIGALTDINTNGATYIAWQWRAGGTPVTNNGGATSSQVSVSQISGFSVVSYTGTSSATTIGHGLGVAPKMIIIKNVNNIATWAIYHDSLGSGSPQTYYLDFSNNLQSNSTAYWNSIKPTVNNFSIGFGTSSVNSSGNPFIAYCFAEIEGYSKFSSYLGNNSTDGTFVYTGFKPKYILIKCITAAGNWALYNSIVNTGNPVINELFANTTAAENSVPNDDIDFLSNGFKLRSTNAAINAAQTYIYAAFAETPFKYATAALSPEVKNTITVDYLVIAGGGGGGRETGGGGGGGGYKSLSSQTLTKGTAYSIIVGGGGAKGTTGSTNGTNGNNSQLSSTIATGGGGGGAGGNNGLNGGSGGGAGRGGTKGLLTTGQGNDGGNGGPTSGSDTASAGGGGGAGSAGSAGTTGVGGNGGNGLSSSITGTAVTRAAGGGGGVYYVLTATRGVGGSVGGGNAGSVGPGTNVIGAGQDGSTNTGGGGGGGNLSNTTTTDGGAGGSGIVIIRWLTSSGSITVGAGLTANPTGTDGLYSYKEFTQGTGNITFN